MDGIGIKIRLWSLAAVTMVLSLVMASRLYDLQIINGDSYYRQSEKKITRSIEVEAARGELLDRYGRKLVTNKFGYNVSFDSTLLPMVRRNEIIGNLIEVCNERGVEYITTLPIEHNGARFYFTTIDENTYTRRLEKYMEALEWTGGLTAEEIIEKQREEYGIDPQLSPKEALEICKVRYELDLRSARIPLNVPRYIFAENVDIELIGIIKERDFPGVSIDTVSVRDYVTTYAAHILGRVGPIFEGEYPALKEKGYALDDYMGKDGTEKAFESWLRGAAGTRVEEINTSGKVTNVMYSEQPAAGNNVILTLDIRLQEATERALERRILEIKELGEAGSSLGSVDVGGGAAVVLDINTGEVLASASYPTYNLATYNRDYLSLIEDPLEPLYNKALMGTYTPGSIFKMATATAALETKVINARTKILDRGIYTYYASSNFTPMCEVYLTSRRTHGSVDVVNALRVSCNYFFYEVGRLTGIEKIVEYARLLGLGEKTGIELDSEKQGTLAGPESRAEKDKVWYPGDTIQAAIGQSDNMFTPIQLANYVATLVNGGVRNRVHVLKSVKSYDYTQTLFESKAEVLGDANISAETLDLIKRGMLAVSESGSAVAIFGNYPIKVGSKTGTAQTGRGSANGTFVAFAPYDKPEIAVAIVVERAGKGSRIGVIARDIFDAYFRIDNSLETIVVENTLVN